MSKQNTIKLNGKLFDAATGKPISSAPKGHQSLIRPTNQSADTHPAAKHSKPKDPDSVHLKHREPHSPHNIRRKTQHTKTLMRHAVKKPVRLQHKISDLKSKSPVSHNIDTLVSLDVMGTRHSRSKRAASVPKSHLIHRFASRDDLIPTVVKRLSKISVKPAPDEPAIEKHTYAPVTEDAPVDLFGNALSNATSHNQKQTKHSRRQRAAKKLGVSIKAVHFGIAAILFVALGGFIMYQNATNIRVRLAAADVGVHASLPGYHPAGFALDRYIQTSPGRVILSFHSNSDGRNFKITQTALTNSNQTSTLAANTGQSFQTISTADGTSVYLYGDSNASFIKDGTLYTIEGDSRLSTSQLLKIANSF